MGRGVVLALVLESRFWSLLCLRWKWCWRLCLGRGRRRARIGTCVEVLVAAVIVLELVLVPAFRSWSPLCSRWNLCRGPGRRCARVGTMLVPAFRSCCWCWRPWPPPQGIPRLRFEDFSQTFPAVLLRLVGTAYTAYTSLVSCPWLLFAYTSPF